MEIPIIDCSKIDGDYNSTDEQELVKFAQYFGDAMSGIGFAYLINHGVDLAKVENSNKMFKSFFELPIDTKSKYRKLNPMKNYNGYSGPGDVLLNKSNSVELRESYDLWGEDGSKDCGYPSEIPGLKLEVDSLRKDLNNLTKKLLKCLGKYLNLADEDFFLKNHSWIDVPSVRTQTLIRYMHYFPLKFEDVPKDAIRCGEHSDFGTITLLFQDMVGGLEVKRTSGEWVPATPITGSVIINSGRLLELWSAGRFPAAPHRVRIVNDKSLLKTPRQSCIYFVNPDGDALVSPIVPILGDKDKKLDSERNVPVIAYDYMTRLVQAAGAHKKY